MNLYLLQIKVLMGLVLVHVVLIKYLKGKKMPTLEKQIYFVKL